MAADELLVCPICRSFDQAARTVRVAPLERRPDDGAWACTNAPACGFVFPEVEGIPVILKPGTAFKASLRFLPEARPLALARLLALLGPEDPLAARARGVGSYTVAHLGDWSPDPEIALAARPNAYSTLAATLAERGAVSGRTIVLGAGPGRLAYELQPFCEEVLALDVALDMLLPGRRAMAGAAPAAIVCATDSLEWRAVPVAAPDPARADRIRFVCGDALDPPVRALVFDTVVAANVVDSIFDPSLLIGQVDAILRPGGRAVIVSPYVWKAETTPPGSWLRGGAQQALALLETYGRATTPYESAEWLPEMEWALRVDANHAVRYRLQGFVARKSA